MLDEALKNVSVIGAAGKMGSGIALLLLQEMARVELEHTGGVGGGGYCLHLIDVEWQSLVELRKYLRVQLIKFAEKNINMLRKGYFNNVLLVSNKDIVQAFVDGATDIVHIDTHIEVAKGSTLIFEAVVEDLEIKIKLLQSLQKICPKAILFLTNTSSIPIAYLNEKADLKNRLVGFHFYNPPAVQKLIEFVALDEMDPHLKGIALDLAEHLHKRVVHSNDVAGFIGNGYLMQEILFAVDLVKELMKIMSQPQAIYFVNRITQEILLRPMGIFQLMDYIGLDVCQKIAAIMDRFLPGSLLSTPLVDEMVKTGLIGGHTPNGEQKEGIFKYNRTDADAIYSLAEHRYIPFNDEWQKQMEGIVGIFPKEAISWKSLQNNPKKNDLLKEYFHCLFQTDRMGAELARRYLRNSRDIALSLVEKGIASKISDVDIVLECGFYHVYGMNYPWLVQELEGINR